MMAGCWSRARSAPAAASPSGCRATLRFCPPSRPPSRHRPPSCRCRSWWSMTKRQCARSWRRSSRAPATLSPRPATGWTRSRDGGREPQGEGPARARRRRGAARSDHERWDLIISDVTMPSLDGPNLIRQLRARGIATPVILMTGRVDSDGLAHAQGSDTISVLAKPFDRATLLATVGAAIGRELKSEN